MREGIIIQRNERVFPVFNPFSVQLIDSKLLQKYADMSAKFWLESAPHNLLLLKNKEKRGDVCDRNSKTIKAGNI